ncbi:MAG: prolyl oligopeptidase family serine peptidase [Fuerstiella sp.]
MNSSFLAQSDVKSNPMLIVFDRYVPHVATLFLAAAFAIQCGCTESPSDATADSSPPGAAQPDVAQQGAAQPGAAQQGAATPAGVESPGAQPPRPGQQQPAASADEIVSALGTIAGLKSAGLKIKGDLSKLEQQIQASVILADQFAEIRERCQKTSHPNTQEESICWKLGLAWRYIGDTLSEANWGQLSADDQMRVVNLMESAVISLPEYSYECEQGMVLRNWPRVEITKNAAIVDKLNILKQQIQDAKFRSHVLGAPDEPFRMESCPLPNFPEAGEAQYSLADGKVDVYEYTLSGEDRPGHNMEIRVLVPAGTTAEAGLPCVLVAPAGSDLESGMSLDLQDEDVYVAESLPYAEHGFAVIEYSLDGVSPSEGVDQVGSRSSYIAFRNAAAGVINARNAIEFAKQKFPIIDQARIFSAGHSSGGNVSLLNAAHFPQLKGAIAYAPASDVVKENYSLPAHDIGFKPGVHSFRRKSSPVTHTTQISCPVLLFHAKDDDTVSFSQSEDFVAALKTASVDVTFHTVDSGGHYQAMVDEGIAKGITWMKAHEAF